MCLPLHLNNIINIYLCRSWPISELRRSNSDNSMTFTQYAS